VNRVWRNRLPSSTTCQRLLQTRLGGGSINAGKFPNRVTSSQVITAIHREKGISSVLIENPPRWCFDFEFCKWFVSTRNRARICTCRRRQRQRGQFIYSLRKKTLRRSGKKNDLLSSGLYRRLRNFTGSCAYLSIIEESSLCARGLYRRSGIQPERWYICSTPCFHPAPKVGKYYL
jgi:hypothetical protein